MIEEHGIVRKLTSPSGNKLIVARLPDQIHVTMNVPVHPWMIILNGGVFSRYPTEDCAIEDIKLFNL